MKYVYLVCGKTQKDDWNYWVSDVCSSAKAAKLLKHWLEKNCNGFWYIRKENLQDENFIKEVYYKEG